MTVKQRLGLNNTILAVSVVAIVSVLLMATTSVRHAIEASKTAGTILSAGYERLLLHTDFQRSGSARSRAQLSAKHQEITRLLQRAPSRFGDPMELKTIAQLRATHDSIGQLTKLLQGDREQSGRQPSAAPLLQERKRRLLSQLNQKVYESILLVNKLQQSAEKEVNAALGAAIGAVALVLVLVISAQALHSLALTRFFAGRMESLRDGAESIGSGNLSHRIEIQGRDEFTELAASFNETAAKLDLLYANLKKEIAERNRTEEALRQAHDELEQRVSERTAELREKDRLLLLQSRQAAMGEMIGNIAHQWRQPLNSLGIAVQQLLLFYDLGKLQRENLQHNVHRSMELIQHMSKTIDDFRSYFRPEKEKSQFKVSEALRKTVALVEDSFKSQRIAIDLIAKDDPVIVGYENEYAQALLNVLNNARDAFRDKNIAKPTVGITIESIDGRSVVTVTDNAGGIAAEIIGKVFDPYFTTKGPQYGTGVGLFMTKTIIEKSMGGTISVRNHADGAEFTIGV